MTSQGNFSHFIMGSYGSIYPTLSKLEAEGLVSCREEREAGKPRRKIYSLNSEGRAALVNALSDESKADIFKSEFLFLCLCSELLDPDHISASINQQVERLSAGIDSLQVARGDCGHVASQFVIDYGISLHKAALDYLVQNRHKLEDRDEDAVLDEIEGERTPLSAQAAE